MARFHGKVGYAITEETVPGVWAPKIIERSYTGDLVRNIRRLEDREPVNEHIAMNNSFSILADAYAYENMINIRYVEFMGNLWSVSAVEVQRPRLILYVTGVYNGDGPDEGTAPDTP